MKDHLRQLVSTPESDLRKRCVTREYLQARILQALQESGVLTNWVFHGGTALRFLYTLPRYSEDLDFSLVDASKDSSLRKMLKTVKQLLEAEDYRVDVKANERKVVHSALVRFPGLLHELGLSPHPTETLSVKVEVDTDPPQGAGWEVTLVRRHVILNLPHHDKASLLSGKLHAVLCRRYTKGRDLYDLVWYLSDRSWPGPNLVFLNNALAQTGWSGPTLTNHNWKEYLLGHLARVRWDRAREDAAPFLERESDRVLLTWENLQSLLR